MNEQELIKQLTIDGIPFDDLKIKLLKKYSEILIESNKTTNLTRIIAPEDIYLKHFYDSLTIMKYADLSDVSTILDVGSGAGFPGMVLAIFNPHIEVTLIDAVNKKTNFLKRVVSDLEIANVKVVHGRAEDTKLFPKESFDLITARAVTQINIFVELTAYLLKVNGHILLQKGQVEEEMASSKRALEKTYLNIKEKHEFFLKNQTNPRTIILYQKIKPTPNIYPRHFSQIKKKPL